MCLPPIIWHHKVSHLASVCHLGSTQVREEEQSKSCSTSSTSSYRHVNLAVCMASQDCFKAQERYSQSLAQCLEQSFLITSFFHFRCFLSFMSRTASTTSSQHGACEHLIWSGVSERNKHWHKFWTWSTDSIWMLQTRIRGLHKSCLTPWSWAKHEPKPIMNWHVFRELHIMSSLHSCEPSMNWAMTWYLSFLQLLTGGWVIQSSEAINGFSHHVIQDQEDADGFSFFVWDMKQRLVATAAWK
jgi:hypothetical protein